ncbi:hypothetical protein FPE01S_04_04550 [Flavihumibacter petaseus NBRC 106054]|uniref:Glycosyltransferase n=1 Tax=Flavihumibacter petaseus NBRC 106054 TaxID=1220578 RepID=A0A0E9N677_9BACT|nr:hypothetical protein FPE01S_04_04550 [Flavihumibacter petaseus NBRC 106054]
MHEDYYEEKLDPNLAALLPEGLRVEKVAAFQVSKPRFIGDIGLRGFFQLYKKAKRIIREEQIDFLYIPIPSFYVALLGRWLHFSTGVKYGIDYIDPWVHHFAGSDRMFSRHWFSTKLSSFLEPIAVKRASLITGVAEGYYGGVKDRNPHLLEKAVFGAMPYGGEMIDYQKVNTLSIEPYLFRRNEKFQLVYAGAMLPKAYGPLEQIFKVIADHPQQFSDLEIHFIGTGKLANDSNSFNIKPIAKKFGLWKTVVFEYPQRIPYLDVLIHLRAADGIFILGSTEPHYTPSKVYQGVMSGKPVFAVLHQESQALKVLQQARAGVVIAFDGEAGLDTISENFSATFEQYRKFVKEFSTEQVDIGAFEQYSAYAVTRQLASLIDLAVEKNS